jgi:amino acid transporter
MDPMTQGQLKEWFVMLAMFGLLGWVAYLGASIVRRKQKTDMQKALLEKFSSAHDFAEFMQSPAGQKYVLNFADAVTGPFNSIMNAVKIGIVLLFAGAALVASGQRHNLWLLDTMGMFSTCVGAGFLISAAISYLLYRRMKSAEVQSKGKD